MSSALAIAGVTAVLRGLLNDGMITYNVSGIIGSTVTVSALPPDRVVPTNGTESTQLNLFLHHVTYNPGWRNQDLPSRDGSGRHRLSNPPLALDLHYLLSAYSAVELAGEILLGHAMQLLHEMPVLDRTAIKNALDPSLPPPLGPLADCGLADQVEQIRLAPEVVSTEEMSKLWTAVQSHYRTSVAYVATVVLIESAQPTKPTLPVLSRGPIDPVTKREQGVAVQPNVLPLFPTVESVLPTNGQPAATVGSTVGLAGHHLDGTDRAVVFSNVRFDIEQEVDEDEGVTGKEQNPASSLRVIVPTLPVGMYQVAARVVRPNEIEARTSNALSLTLSPYITTGLPLTVARDGTGTARIMLTCRPEITVGQQASLLLGTVEVHAEPRLADTETLTFTVEQAPVGSHLVRLRVDGIESPLIDQLANPPAFFDYRITIT